jgi:kynureninase
VSQNGKYNLDEARKLDASNELSIFRSRFYIPPGKIYMDGNSLGLLSTDAEKSLLRVIEEWKTLGIDGWMKGGRPWFNFGEEIGELAGGLVGAERREVIFSGTTTVNIHNLVGGFFEPIGSRQKILADKLNFPSDLYALKGQLKLRGMDPEKFLVLAEPGPNGLLDEDSIIGQMNEEVVLLFLPSVLYRSGQLLDIEKLTAAAHERDILAGFDCSHSVGVIPHDFSKWNVDFALWCSYKYLNGGPGAPAFLYVNKKHFDRYPSLPGWFGSDKERQFEMLPDFIPATGAGRWQISSPGIISASPVEGSMKIIHEAGIDKIREMSLRLTDFLSGSLESSPAGKSAGFRIITPAEPRRRGGHIAFEHPEAARIYEALIERGIITDIRPPDIIRVAPSPLYNTFEEIHTFTNTIAAITQNL